VRKMSQRLLSSSLSVSVSAIWAPVPLLPEMVPPRFLHDGRAGFIPRTGSVDAAMDDWAMKLVFSLVRH